MKDFKTFFENKGPCWPGYVQVGMKKKNGKDVPNCVPKEEVEEGKNKKSETWEDGFKRRVVPTTKPDFAEFKKQMRRVAGHEFGG